MLILSVLKLMPFQIKIVNFTMAECVPVLFYSGAYEDVQIEN